jgi:hypothetical protein
MDGFFRLLFQPECIMKMRLPSPVTIPLMLAAAALTACATRTSYVDLYGEPASASRAERTIVIDTGTKHVNVTGGEIIRFVAGNKEFTWNFFIGRKSDSFDLNEVAPPGLLDHPVRAYVSPDPRYIGGGPMDR